MTTATADFVVVYHARDAAQAHLVQVALEAAGIETHVENEYLQPVALPTIWASEPLVLVDESNVAAAQEIIQSIDSINSTEPSDEVATEVTSCLACGTQMTDSETKCHICGWTYNEGFE